MYMVEARNHIKYNIPSTNEEQFTPASMSLCAIYSIFSYEAVIEL